MASRQLQRIADEIQKRLETWVSEYGEDTELMNISGEWRLYFGSRYIYMGIAPGVRGDYEIKTYLRPREAIIGASVVINENKLVAYWVCLYEYTETGEEFLKCFPLFSVTGDLTKVREMDDFLRLHCGAY